VGVGSELNDWVWATNSNPSHYPKPDNGNACGDTHGVIGAHTGHMKAWVSTAIIAALGEGGGPGDPPAEAPLQVSRHTHGGADTRGGRSPVESYGVGLRVVE